MPIHSNSRKSLAEMIEILNGRKKEIYEYIAIQGARTDRQVMNGLGYTDMNSVRPRITELIDKGILKEVCDRQCPVTHKRVRVVNVCNPRQPKQNSLFSEQNSNTAQQSG